MKVLIDTSAFISFFVKQDASHDEVVEKFEEYKIQKTLLFTSNFILDELFTRLIYDFNKSVATKIINTIERMIKVNELRVISVDEVVFNKAILVAVKYIEHKISLTDATSYVLYKELAIDEIFTLDSDFKKMRVKTSF